MASNIAVNDQMPTDSFADALKVAQAALEASNQVYQAENRARYIEELAFKAHGEVRRLRNVAQSMVNTAVSVSNMALDLCGYNSYRQAFREHPEYREIVPYEDFVNLIASHGSHSRNRGIQPFVPDSSQNGWVHGKQTRQYDLIDDGKYYNSRRPRNYSQEEDRGFYCNKTGPRGQDGQEMVLDTWEDTDDLVEPLGQQPKPRSKQRPGSGRQYKATANSYNSEDDNSGEKIKVKVDSTEKFPSSTPDEYRCHLATSFENTACIAPLWEDRYVDVKERESTSVHNSERWNEKKAMKQFQIKLQQAKLDDTVSAEDSFCHSDVQPRGSFSATPDKHGRSPSSNQDRALVSRIQGSTAAPSRSDPESSNPISGKDVGALGTEISRQEDCSKTPQKEQRALDAEEGCTRTFERNAHIAGNLEEIRNVQRSPEKMQKNAVLEDSTKKHDCGINGSDIVSGQCSKFLPVDGTGKDAVTAITIQPASPVVSNSRKTKEQRGQSSYSNHANSNSSDSELEEIMKEPRVLRHLRKMEYHQPMTRLVPPKTTRQTRPISPLLNSSEKEHYTLSGEESPLSPSTTPPPLRYRQVYKPLSRPEMHEETPE